VSRFPVYLDTSAVLKLILVEPESDDMQDAMAGWPGPVSSRLAAVECARALKRISAPPKVRKRAAQVLESVTLVNLDSAVLRLAETVGSPELRTLDAIHLATALSLGDVPEAFVTYDDRLAAAARRMHLTVRQPGR
jgi:predicted nucleic acid-binding protein